MSCEPLTNSRKSILPRELSRQGKACFILKESSRFSVQV